MLEAVAMQASSELLEHTAEVRLRVRAGTFAELAAEAGRAMARVELGGEPPAAYGGWRELEIRSPDREAALVDWLNELVFLAETERWVATEFEVSADAADALRARARGVEVPEAPARIKAATFHGLQVRAVPGGLEAEVVLDV